MWRMRPPSCGQGDPLWRALRAAWADDDWEKETTTRAPVSSAGWTPVTCPKGANADAIVSNESPTAGPQLATYRLGLGLVLHAPASASPSPSFPTATFDAFAFASASAFAFGRLNLNLGCCCSTIFLSTSAAPSISFNSSMMEIGRERASGGGRAAKGQMGFLVKRRAKTDCGMRSPGPDPELGILMIHCHHHVGPNH